MNVPRISLMKQPDLNAFRLLLGAMLSLVLICWVWLGGILMEGFIWGVIIYGLAAPALSSTIVVSTIPVLLRGSRSERVGALLIIPLPLLILISIIGWVVVRNRW